jgi:hypothetical protein
MGCKASDYMDDSGGNVVIHRLFLFLTFAVLTSCTQVNYLAQTPNVLLPIAQYPDSGLPDSLKTTQSTIYYMTDREPAENANARSPYSS